ncbi:DUF6221 family protein [Streptomyces sp. NPDC020707]|uniref:DUF6221 family protein n=1 Tax=Streptomyces sp. NPDC020707 TaxID=3365084 RepID=UPI003791A56D
MGIVSDLTHFLDDRYDEEQRDTVLFHEFGCLVPLQTARGRPCPCPCPCPAEMLDQIAVNRRILRNCEHQIWHEQDAGPRWPLESTLAFTTMKAFALPYELHPAWRDIWYP